MGADTPIHPKYDERRRPRRDAPAAVQSGKRMRQCNGSNIIISIIYELKGDLH
jgi:hypothetical protein